MSNLHDGLSIYLDDTVQSKRLAVSNASDIIHDRRRKVSNYCAGNIKSFDCDLASHAAQFIVGRERIDEHPCGKFVVKGKQQSFVTAGHFNPA